MSELVTMHCEVCRTDAPKATSEEIAVWRMEVPSWVIMERDDVQRLECVFKFKNFVQALAFTNTIGALAEQEGHHPTILTEWGKVGVAWWTHKIGGLHRNDFIMAAYTDQAYRSYLASTP